mmetsp:Transcript_1304/g.3044  ORF Transcript_1304/g.3044 Transcript_1304/m.3044 type:complete len:470 (-) Transcript_1304:147-1556(-)
MGRGYLVGWHHVQDVHGRAGVHRPEDQGPAGPGPRRRQGHGGEAGRVPVRGGQRRRRRVRLPARRDQLPGVRRAHGQGGLQLGELPHGGPAVLLHARARGGVRVHRVLRGAADRQQRGAHGGGHRHGQLPPHRGAQQRAEAGRGGAQGGGGVPVQPHHPQGRPHGVGVGVPRVRRLPGGPQRVHPRVRVQPQHRHAVRRRHGARHPQRHHVAGGQEQPGFVLLLRLLLRRVLHHGAVLLRVLALRVLLHRGGQRRHAVRGRRGGGQAGGGQQPGEAGDGERGVHHGVAAGQRPGRRRPGLLPPRGELQGVPGRGARVQPRALRARGVLPGQQPAAGGHGGEPDHAAGQQHHPHADGGRRHYRHALPRHGAVRHGHVSLRGALRRVLPHRGVRLGLHRQRQPQGVLRRRGGARHVRERHHADGGDPRPHQPQVCGRAGVQRRRVVHRHGQGGQGSQAPIHGVRAVPDGAG